MLVFVRKLRKKTLIKFIFAIVILVLCFWYSSISHGHYSSGKSQKIVETLMKSTDLVTLSMNKPAEKPSLMSGRPKTFHLLTTLSNSDALENVKFVLSQHDYQEVKTACNSCNLVWPFYYNAQQYWDIFNMSPIENRKMKVGFILGLELITSKYQFSLSGLPNVPKTFRLPEDILQFKEHLMNTSQKYFISKKKTHHGIHLLNSKYIIKKIKRRGFLIGHFIQQFVDRPMLIEGHKFDIGVHVVVASMDPLRVYMFEKEILIRLALEKYYPFNEEISQKYIVENIDDYDIFMEIPEIKKTYVSLNNDRKALLNYYLQHNNHNPSEVWSSIRSAIHDVFHHFRRRMQASFNIYRRQDMSFFELVRFDFVLDEDANLFVMEINHNMFLGNTKVPYKQDKNRDVINATLTLVGAFHELDDMNGEKDDYCQFCETFTCTDFRCLTCPMCLSKDSSFASALFEDRVHRQMGFQRAFPRSFKDQAEARIYARKLGNNASQQFDSGDQKLLYWHLQRCLKEEIYCS